MTATKPQAAQKGKNDKNDSKSTLVTTPLVLCWKKPAA
jgi:hypothetical protein